MLLPSRPNGSTGWIQASRVRSARTSISDPGSPLHEVDGGVSRRHVDRLLAGRHRHGQHAYAHRPGISVGRDQGPRQSFSPVILPLGTHWSTLDTYGGGPEPSPSIIGQPAEVYGRAGQPRLHPGAPDALRTMQTVPLDTIVLTNSRQEETKVRPRSVVAVGALTIGALPGTSLPVGYAFATETTPTGKTVSATLKDRPDSGIAGNDWALAP